MFFYSFFLASLLGVVSAFDCPSLYNVALDCENAHICSAFEALLGCAAPSSCIASIGAFCDPVSQCIIIHQSNVTAEPSLLSAPFKWLEIAGSNVNYTKGIEQLLATPIGQPAYESAFRFSRAPGSIWQISQSKFIINKQHTAALYNIHDCVLEQTFRITDLVPAGVTLGYAPIIFTTSSGWLVVSSQDAEFIDIHNANIGWSRLPLYGHVYRILLVNGSIAYEYRNGSIKAFGITYAPGSASPQTWIYWENETFAYNYNTTWQLLFNETHWLPGRSNPILETCASFVFGYTEPTLAEPLPKTKATFSVIVQTLLEKVQQETLLVLLLLGIPLLVIVIPLLILLLIFTMKIVHLFGFELEDDEN